VEPAVRLGASPKSITKMIVDGCMRVARVRVVVMSIMALSAGNNNIVVCCEPASWQAATAWCHLTNSTMACMA
jgi:hypothetical protein